MNALLVDPALEGLFALMKIDGIVWEYLLDWIEGKIYVIVTKIQNLSETANHSFLNQMNDLLNDKILLKRTMILCIYWPIFVNPYFHLGFAINANRKRSRIVYLVLWTKKLIRMQSIDKHVYTLV
jgi:hypothetical protein